MMDMSLCACGVVHMLDMQCCIHRVLCTCSICSAMYIWYCVHVVHVELCTYGVVCLVAFSITSCTIASEDIENV